MKVLFLGSSLFSKIVLEKVLSSKHSICGVITQPPKEAGRGHKLQKTCVHEFALENNIPVYTFERLSRSFEEVKKIDFDIALVASFGQILTQEFLDNRPCINVHPSLLPKYRGATPIQSALLNGDTETGVTIMKVVKQVDAGDIILQESMPLSDDIMFSSLESELAELGGELAVKALDLFEKNNVKFTTQDNDRAVIVKQLCKEDGHLDFSKSAKDVYNRFRALSECLGCYIMLGENKIKVTDMEVVDMHGKAGEVLLAKKRLVIACKDKAIEIKKCQAMSGKVVDAGSFLNGWREEIKEVK